MSSARHRLSAAIAASVLAAVLAGNIAAAQDGGPGSSPTVVVDRTGTAAGEQMLVTGNGWPAGHTLIVELCGHGGLRGSVDCDVTQQRTAGVGTTGTFSVVLTSSLPPTPCPCVVKATDQTTQVAATSSIAVAGLPTVPITADDQGPVRRIEVSAIEITGAHRWTELFGAHGRRTLVLTLVNTGSVAVDAPDVSVTWGRGRVPDGFVSPPQTVRMEPGATQTLRVALERPAFAFGSYTAVVEVQGLDAPVIARATSTAYPWGLAVIALVLLQLLLLRLRNRVRRRLHRTPRTHAHPDVLALGPAGPDLDPRGVAPAAPELLPASDEHTVIDLDDVGPRPAEPVDGTGRNGPALAGPAPASMPVELAAGDPSALQVERLRQDVAQLRASAQTTVRQAVDLSQSLITACVARVQEVDAIALQQLQTAAARHAHATQALDLATERARALIDATDAADAAVTSAVRASTEARDALSAASAAIVAESRQLADAVHAEMAQALAELDDEVGSVVASAPSDQTPRPKPADLLDRRLALAIQRALDVLPADAPAD